MLFIDRKYVLSGVLAGVMAAGALLVPLGTSPGPDPGQAPLVVPPPGPVPWPVAVQDSMVDLALAGGRVRLSDGAQVDLTPRRGGPDGPPETRDQRVGIAEANVADLATHTGPVWPDPMAALAAAGGAASAVVFLDPTAAGVIDPRVDGFYDTEPESIITGLGEQRLLPDLADTDLDLVLVLPADAPYWVAGVFTGLWGGIARAGGATVRVHTTTGPATGQPYPTPVVTVDPAPPTGKPSCTLDSAALFTENTATPRDPGALDRAVRRCARALPPGAQLRLDGHTSKDPSPPAAHKRLSLQRARTVQAYFVQAGWPADHIRVRGLGWRHPLVDPPTAAGNRAVTVTVTS